MRRRSSCRQRRGRHRRSAQRPRSRRGEERHEASGAVGSRAKQSVEEAAARGRLKNELRAQLGRDPTAAEVNAYRDAALLERLRRENAQQRRSTRHGASFAQRSRRTNAELLKQKQERR